MKILKGLLGAAAFLAIGGLIASKSHTKTPDKIMQKARRKYGACTLVSTGERDGKVYVTVHDTLQDFDYTLCSAMHSMDCDGSALFHYENTTDDFELRLRERILGMIRPELDALLAQYGASVIAEKDISCSYLRLCVPEEQSAADVCCRCAALLQRHNLRNRLDGKTVSAESAPHCHIGSVTLPELRFLDREAETVRWVTDHLKRTTGAENIQYLSKAQLTLAELGCPPDCVSHTAGQYFPQKPEDAVDCYFFEINGRELLAAHFFDNRTGELFRIWRDTQ